MSRSGNNEAKRTADGGEDASWFRVDEEPTLPELTEALTEAPLVLVVEDNCDNRDLFVALLTELGCRVLAADDGYAGLRLARICRPDLIVSDISMPVMDGCEMVQRLRQDERTCRMPVIAVTGFGPGWHEAALLSGCNMVLAKPTDPDDFDAAVLSFTRSPREGSPPPARP